MKTDLSLDRRRFLRGTGVCLALPSMESLLPRSARAIEQVSQAKRLAAMTLPFGMVVDKFHPTESGRDYLLTPTLQPLGKLKDDFTVFSNFDHDVRGGHAANHTLLSGVNSTERAGYPAAMSRWINGRPNWWGITPASPRWSFGRPA